jgi:hypothetical protein
VRFRKEIHFPGTLDEVRTMILDPEFRNQVSLAAGGQPAESQVVETPEGTLSVNDTRPDVSGVPAFARPIIGGHLVIHQEELWVAPHLARMTVHSEGKPGRIEGTITLTATHTGTTQTTEAEIRVTVPLVGGQVEKLMGRILGSLLKTQARIGAEWLTSRR